jgi:hypothetical protein
MDARTRERLPDLPVLVRTADRRRKAAGELEIGHHSLAQYRLPTTGELVPLLQIAPSKTERRMAPTY